VRPISRDALGSSSPECRDGAVCVVVKDFLHFDRFLVDG
jgi:hypothetical protein